MGKSKIMVVGSRFVKICSKKGLISFAAPLMVSTHLMINFTQIHLFAIKLWNFYILFNELLYIFALKNNTWII